MFIPAVYGTCTGKLRGRFGDVADRAKNPKRYWSWLVVYYLAGIGFIGCFLYQAGALSKLSDVAHGRFILGAQDKKAYLGG